MNEQTTNALRGLKPKQKSEIHTPQYKMAESYFDRAYKVRHLSGVSHFDKICQLDRLDAEISNFIADLNGIEFPRSVSLAFDARRLCFERC